jgi:hypothetical protein
MVYPVYRVDSATRISWIQHIGNAANPKPLQNQGPGVTQQPLLSFWSQRLDPDLQNLPRWIHKIAGVKTSTAALDSAGLCQLFPLSPTLLILLPAAYSR